MRFVRGLILFSLMLGLVYPASTQYHKSGKETKARPKLAGFYTLIPPKVIDRNFSPLFLDVTPFSADLNGDGNEDLVVLGVDYACCGDPVNVPQASRVFFGDGKGTFTSPMTSKFPLKSFKMVDPRKVVFGDLNGDGRLDMFIACTGYDGEPYPGERNRLYLSTPQGSWRDASSTLLKFNGYTHSAAAGDLSGRGVLDLIVSGSFTNPINSYSLLNNGAGHFTMTRANIPVGPGEVMDGNTGHGWGSMTLADLDGDGLPELILGASGPLSPYNTLIHSTILWNQAGVFRNDNITELPLPAPFFDYHDEQDVQPIDFNGDGLIDLVVVGTQSNHDAYYDGWYVQLLLNKGDKTFMDVTAKRLAPSDRSGGKLGVVTHSSPPYWVKVLDFDSDGVPDFAVEYAGALAGWSDPHLNIYGNYMLPNTPVIYLNRGGHFSTLKVRDFVAHGYEQALGGAHVMRTQNGYSFITPFEQLWEHNGLQLTGLLATKPYRRSP